MIHPNRNVLILCFLGAHFLVHGLLRTPTPNLIRRAQQQRIHICSSSPPSSNAFDFGLPSTWDLQSVERLDDFCADGSLVRNANPLLGRPNVPNSYFVGYDAAVAARVEVSGTSEECPVDQGAFVLAGPREEVKFSVGTTRAVIVTCGGLCPGVNTVVRELVLCLHNQYGITDVRGVPSGYRGFQDPSKWRPLTPESVRTLHREGGSTLGTSRGGHDTVAIVDALVQEEVGLVFVVGGDGTIRGAQKVAAEIRERKLPIGVALVPKTIDNDIPLVDKTFGFDTAVEQARKAIEVAHTEAVGFPNGLGVVKLMGRHSGFIAMHATLGTGDVDLCLIPEVPFPMTADGQSEEEEETVLSFIESRLVKQGYAVVVIAEGAGQDHLAAEAQAANARTDASGNRQLADVGQWFCGAAKSHLDKQPVCEADKIALKYVDPTYMVRGVPPNTADTILCTLLAHHAVHGALAGFTNFLVGPINGRFCYLPLSTVVNRKNKIYAASADSTNLWARTVFSTGQPSFKVDVDACDIEAGMELTTASGGCVDVGEELGL